MSSGKSTRFCTHGQRLSDGRGAEDLPGRVFLCQRGYAHRHDRRPTPLAKHSRTRRLEAHARPHLQSGARGLLFCSAGAWTSTQRLTRVIEVASDEKEYTDTVAVKILDTNGNLIVTGCGTTVATRMK
jgi:hypothetical protein